MSRIELFLESVSKNNNYYKQIIADNRIKNVRDLKEYPILSRKQLQKNRYKMFTDGYKLMYYNQKLRRQYSSGTSGVPVNVYWDNKSYFKSVFEIWKYRKRYYDISALSKRVEFTLFSFSESPSRNLVKIENNCMKINRGTVKSEDDFKNIISEIERFEPDWFYIQPSFLYYLLEAYKKNGIQPPDSLRYIESVGEVLPALLKTKAAEFFKSKVANMYGSEENNSIAYECPCGNMHILSNNVFVEVYRNGNLYSEGCGDAVITNLNNMAMPLIRYAQNDYIKIISGCDCPCGCQSPVLDIIYGRTSDCVKIGELVISTFLLLEIINTVNNIYSDAIEGFHFIYNQNSKRLICTVKLNSGFYKAESRILAKICEVSRRKIGCSDEILIESNCVDNLDIAEGKYNIFTVV